MQDTEAAQPSGMDAEENMGISYPLYQIIDVVFDLRARGFLRRQVSQNIWMLPHFTLFSERGLQSKPYMLLQFYSLNPKP